MGDDERRSVHARQLIAALAAGTIAVGGLACRAAAACVQADAPAHVVREVVPELPRAYRGIGGVVQVAVTLDAAAHIRSASVYRSTNRLLDASALRSTLATRFAPEIRGCRPRGGTFRYIVAFHSPPIPWTKAARRESRPIPTPRQRKR